MKPKHQRLAWIGVSGALLALAATLIVNAFDENLVYFYAPTDLHLNSFSPQQRIRVGGLVQQKSIKREGETATFVITDESQKVSVRYTGPLPDLFREGQGVVVEGHFDGRVFLAKSVLAKHDENYMPPEVAKALKDKGVWRHAE